MTVKEKVLEFLQTKGVNGTRPHWWSSTDIGRILKIRVASVSRALKTLYHEGWLGWTTVNLKHGGIRKHWAPRKAVVEDEIGIRRGHNHIDNSDEAYRKFLDRDTMLANGQYDEIWYINSDVAKADVAQIQRLWPGRFADHLHKNEPSTE
jgi:hypothetical protein